jgi:hypothetical protein
MKEENQIKEYKLYQNTNKKNSELYNTLLYQQQITDHLFCQVPTSNNEQGQLQILYLQEVT